MESQGITWNNIDSLGVTWNNVNQHEIAWNIIAYHGIASITWNHVELQTRYAHSTQLVRTPGVDQLGLLMGQQLRRGITWNNVEYR